RPFTFNIVPLFTIFSSSLTRTKIPSVSSRRVSPTLLKIIRSADQEHNPQIGSDLPSSSNRSSLFTPGSERLKAVASIALGETQRIKNINYLCPCKGQFLNPKDISHQNRFDTSCKTRAFHLR